MQLNKGDRVVVTGKVIHVREDGGVDVTLSNGQVLFNMDPEDVGLVIEEDI